MKPESASAAPPGPDADKEELRFRLELAISYRNHEDQIIWTAFGIFFATNAVLLVALFQTGDFPNAPVGTLISLAGAFMSVAWALIQRRALGHLERYEALAERIERKLNLPSCYAISIRVNQEDYEKYLKNKQPRARHVMQACGWGAVVAWGAASLIYVFTWVCSVTCLIRGVR